MSKVVEMLGKTYGELTVIEEFSRTKKKKCVCQCSCGKVVEKSRRDVKSGNTKSCGCLKKRLAQERYTKDLTGLRFGKWEVTDLSFFLITTFTIMVNCVNFIHKKFKNR